MIKKEFVEDFMERQEERIDDLEYKGLKIIQNKEWFCFGIDSVILSEFAKNIKPNTTVIDLGTGNGIISLLLSQKTNCSKIYGIEIQSEVAKMAARSVKLNHLEKKITILECDVKKLDQYFEKESIDAIVSNPPYKKKESGIKSQNRYQRIARQEEKANLEDFIRISQYLLKEKAEIYLIHRPERLVDIFSLFREYKIEPKIIRFVQSKIEKAPNLVLVKGVKGAKPFLKIEPPLILYQEDGGYTEEVLAIYHKEKRR